MVIHLPTHWVFKIPLIGWSRYRDANTIPTSPLADDITTALSGPVNNTRFLAPKATQVNHLLLCLINTDEP